MREQPSCRITALAFLVLVFSGLVCAQSPVVIQVDAGRSLGPLPPIWNYFGYDEPNYTYAPHGRELIAELFCQQPLACANSHTQSPHDRR